jgi:hypothetical protein
MTERTHGRGWGRGQGRGRGRGHLQGSRHGLQIKLKLVLVQIECKLFVHNWEGKNNCVGPHIRIIVKMMAND